MSAGRYFTYTANNLQTPHTEKAGFRESFVPDEDRQENKRHVRMGRPPLPRTRARSNRVVTFVTDSEMASLT